MSTQPCVLLLQVGHLLTKEGVLLGQSCDHGAILSELALSPGITLLEVDQHDILPRKSRLQPDDLLFQFLAPGTFVSQQQAERRLTGRLSGEAVVHRTLMLRHS
ncbi:MAG: hypothetical protein NVSMB4_19090 [Acidimicrobiales bacterium]